MLLYYWMMFKFSAEGGDGGAGGDPGDAGDKGGNPAGDHMIPKHRFDEVSKKLKDSETTIADLTTKVEQLTAKDARIAELEAEVKAIKDGHEVEKVTSTKKQIIKERVGDKVFDFELLLTLIDLDAISVNSEGKVKGLSAQVKELQKSKPYLWKPAEPVVNPGAGGKTKTEKTFAQKLAEEKVRQNAVVDKGKKYF